MVRGMPTVTLASFYRELRNGRVQLLHAWRYPIIDL